MTRWGKCLAISLAAVLVIAVGVSAKDAVTFGNISSAKVNPSTRMVTIPLDISNTKNLAAIDVPLKFGEPGDAIELVEVDFESGRAHYFDVKVANIDNEEKTVILGLLWLAYQESSDAGQPELKTGGGHLATLTFEVSDPDIEEITLVPTTFTDPHHELSFIYNETGPDGLLRVEQISPEFGEATFPIAPANRPAIPETWGLHQNYPNPFNASTVIYFDLPQASHVVLDVYNILGQRVGTLADEYMEAGTRSVTWNADVASGVYFYRLQADDFSSTRKMTLLK